MPSSELSDALNPLYTRGRPPIEVQPQTALPTSGQNYAQQPQRHVVRADNQVQSLPRSAPGTLSELDFALTAPRPATRPLVAPPPPQIPSVPTAPPPTLTATTSSTNSASFDGHSAVRELLRSIATTKDAAEKERSRRAAWEREQEEKTARLEEEVAKLRDELLRLREENDTLASAAPQPTPPTVLPVHPQDQASMPTPALTDSSTPSMSLQRKRPRPEGTDDEDEESSSEDELALKRLNKHDKRVLTIHHAMRIHVLQSMGLKNDKNLPDSHIEGAPLSQREPVRFNWDLTTKKSKHNASMKKRVLSDLITHSMAYPEVPKKDFDMKRLEAIFDQHFTTLRQKVRAQRDEGHAERQRASEEAKAKRKRRAARKKEKQRMRESARKHFEGFSHPTFDSALQIDCMSSEESDLETDGTDFEPKRIFILRGLIWRSSRLQRFYEILDEDEIINKQLQPRRVPKLDRRPGPPKESDPLPPQGIASWMVSQRWKKVIEETNPLLIQSLDTLVVDPPGFDWSRFLALGTATDDES